MSASRLEDAIRAPVHARRLVILAALAAAGPARAGVHVQLTPSSTSVAPGDTITVSAIVTPADSAFNAFDLVVRFDPARVTFVPQYPTSKQIGPLMTTACAQIFHAFLATPDSLTASVSLLCANKTVTGPGTIYTVKFRASTIATGTTTITCGPATTFYNGGVFVTPVACAGTTITVGAVGVGETAPRVPTSLDVVRREPLTLQITLPDDADVAVEMIDVRGRIVARRASEHVSSGTQALAWRTPRLAAGAYTIRARIAGGPTLTRRWIALP